MHVVTVEVGHLGNRCHLVHDGSRALVVDPPRDLRAVERAVEQAGVEVSAVAETHVHNDFVSGAPALARGHGADHLLSAAEHVDVEHVGVRDGDVVAVGGLEVEVLDTPGHTPHHQSFLVRGARTGAGERPAALLSGGSLLHGTVGRTDLVHPSLALDLARAQWTSARRQTALPGTTRLLPTHGFGSSCAAAPVDQPDGPVTVGHQHPDHPALRQTQEAFAVQLVEGFGPIPRWYPRIAPLNRAGTGCSPRHPARLVDAEEVADAVLRGSWVVDLRDRGAYARGHLAGSVNVGWSDQFATYVGWLVPWGSDREDDLVLLTDTPEVLEDAVRQLADLGIDGVGAHVLDPAQPLPASYRVTDWAGWRDAQATPAPGAAGQPRRVLVDVRQRDERDDEHLPGSVHLAVQDVEAGAAALPAGELWVHCRSGYRAGIAASVLHRLGRSVVHLDDAWEQVAVLGLATRRGPGPAPDRELGVSA